MEIGVIAVTDGEACYPGEPWWTPDRLRSARRQSLQRRWRNGIAADATFHLGIGDGAVSKHEQGLQDWLQQHLQPGDLVLAPWRFDGHPDHEAAGRAACRAARVGCRRLEYPVWGWHWLDPACAHMAWEFPACRHFRSGVGETKCDRPVPDADGQRAGPEQPAGAAMCWPDFSAITRYFWHERATVLR